MNKNIVFTAYNRPDYLSRALDSWREAKFLERWHVSASIEPSEFQDDLLVMFLDKFRGKAASVNPLKNESRRGVLTNPWVSMENSFYYGSDFTILAEDDVVVSKDVLEYFEWAMEYYKGDKRVLSILAFSKLPAEGNGQTSDVKASSLVAQTPNFCPLIWGTWADRWYEHISETWDFDYSSGNPDGSEAGWDWNLSRVAKNNRKHFVFPVLSRSDHIGELGGTHMIPSDFPSSTAPTFKADHKRKVNFQEWSAT